MFGFSSAKFSRYTGMYRRLRLRLGYRVCIDEVKASQLAQASERVGSLIPASQQG